MKSKEMRFVAVLLLVLLGCKTVWSMAKASQSGLAKVAGVGEKCGVERLGSAPDMAERIGWNEQIGQWRRKGRPYRNPLRRYRLGKKRRMELRRCLARLHEIEEALGQVGGEVRGELTMAIAVVADARAESGRWG